MEQPPFENPLTYKYQRSPKPYPSTQGLGNLGRKLKVYLHLHALSSEFVSLNDTQNAQGTEGEEGELLCSFRRLIHNRRMQFCFYRFCMVV